MLMWLRVGQTEISLQPWRAFRPDGVILFSDILTPLTGMGIDFQIGEGIHVEDPIRTMQVEPLFCSLISQSLGPPLGNVIQVNKGAWSVIENHLKVEC